MIILDFIVRIALLITVIYMIHTTVEDIKSGALKNFFGDNDEDEEGRF